MVIVSSAEDDTLAKGKAGKAAGKNNILRNLVVPLYQLEDMCNDDQGAPEVCVVDLLLYLYGYTCALTFRQVLNGLKQKAKDFLSIEGSKVLIYSFDKSDYVPIAKAPEQNKRALKNIRRDLGVDHRWLVYHKEFQERQELKKGKRLSQRKKKKIDIPLESVVIPPDWEPELDEYLPEDWRLYVQDKQGARKKIVSFLSRALLGQLDGFETFSLRSKQFFVIDGHCWTDPQTVLSCMQQSDPSRSQKKMAWRSLKHGETREEVLYDTPLTLSKHLVGDDNITRLSLFLPLENKCGESDQFAFFAMDRLRKHFKRFYLCSCDTDWFYYGLHYMKEADRRNLTVYLSINRLNLRDLFHARPAKGFHVNLLECVDAIRARFTNNDQAVETLLMFMVNAGGDFVNDWGASSAYQASEALFRFGDYFTEWSIVQHKDISTMNTKAVSTLYVSPEAYIAMVGILFFYRTFPAHSVEDLIEYAPRDLVRVLGSEFPPVEYLLYRIRQLNVALFFLAQSHHKSLAEPNLEKLGYVRVDPEKPMTRSNIMRIHDPLTSNLNT